MDDLAIAEIVASVTKEGYPPEALLHLLVKSGRGQASQPSADFIELPG
jgi:hypothetical protein